MTITKPKSLLAALLLLPLGASAQSPSSFKTEGYKFGAAITPGITWLSTASDDPAFYEAENNGSKGSFAYGIVVDKYLGENYAVNFQFRHSYVNADFTYYPIISMKSDTFFTRKLNLQYIDIPVTFKAMTNQIAYSRYYLQAGIVPSFRVSARGDYSTKNTPEVQGIKVNDDINIMNFGTYLGVGWEYLLGGGNTSAFAGIGWTNNLVNVWKRESDTRVTGAGNKWSENISTRLNMITLTMGVLF